MHIQVLNPDELLHATKTPPNFILKYILTDMQMYFFLGRKNLSFIFQKANDHPPQSKLRTSEEKGI